MDGFDVTQRDDGGIAVLYLKGFLDAHTAPILENALEKCVNEQKFRIIVSFAELTYISSAGLGVFMGFIEEIRQHEGDIKLSSMSEKIFRVFDLLGFPALYDITDTDEEAKAKFEN